MDHRSDKIVRLARAMVRSDYVSSASDIAGVTKPHLSIPTLYMTALLSAFGSGAVVTAVAELNRPINHYEKTELAALSFYAARQLGQSEQFILDEAKRETGIPDLQTLSVGEFRKLRDHLRRRAS